RTCSIFAHIETFPIQLPKGARIDLIAVYDKSERNPRHSTSARSCLLERTDYI
ncbi:MAG: hypothetical protein JWN14_3165, partial [Chthonomonadales bacterium]|nr:hypothetical protein [Chthonomonadales bacterium]